MAVMPEYRYEVYSSLDAQAKLERRGNQDSLTINQWKEEGKRVAWLQ